MDSILGFLCVAVTAGLLSAVVLVEKKRRKSVGSRSSTSESAPSLPPAPSLSDWLVPGDTRGAWLLTQAEDHIKSEQSWALLESARIRVAIESISKDRYEGMTPAQVLAKANSDENKAFLEIVGEKKGTPEHLILVLRSMGSNSVKEIWRMFTVTDESDISVPYMTLIQDSAKKFGIKIQPGETLYAAEVRLTSAAFARLLGNLPEDKKRNLLTELSKRERGETYGKEVAVGGGIVAAQLSGFGIYLASSTVVGAATSIIGVTLPFAAYTGMSSLISVAIGPVGWVALGGWLLYKLGKPDVNVVSAGVLLIANIRQRLIHEREVELHKLRVKQGALDNVYMSEIRSRIKLIREFKRINSGVDSNFYVDRSFWEKLKRPA